MDRSTGEIHHFDTLEELAAAQKARVVAGKAPLLAIRRDPKPSCRHCHGRGHVGQDTRTGHFVSCRCTH